MRLKVMRDCTVSDDGIMAKKDDIILVNSEDAKKLISTKVATELEPEVKGSAEKTRKSSKEVLNG